MFESLFDIDPEAAEADLRAKVEQFEQMKSAAAAAQARATALWAAKRHAAEEAAGVSMAKRGRGLAAEIALARHDAPVCGNKKLSGSPRNGARKKTIHVNPLLYRSVPGLRHRRGFN